MAGELSLRHAPRQPEVTYSFSDTAWTRHDNSLSGRFTGGGLPNRKTNQQSTAIAAPYHTCDIEGQEGCEG
ncbi:hypothetical protein GCM10027589_35240 [Actinocorallia lasiicapitis]